MIAEFFDPAIVDDRDDVAVSDGRQSMSDHDSRHSSFPCKVIQSAKKRRFCRGIQRTRSLIQNLMKKDDRKLIDIY